MGLSKWLSDTIDFMECSIQDCPHPAIKRGYCNRHYKRWLRHGDPLGGGHDRTPGRKTCKARYCDRLVVGHGWCVKHYNRWIAGKDPEAPTWHDMTIEERFLSKVDKNGPVPGWRPDLGPCWVWTAARHSFGYGAFCPGNGDTVAAHRWSYEHFVGPIPDGLEIDHLCRNPPCCRPDHLDPVTGYDNQHRSPITFASINSGKAFCDRGHEFTPENTRIAANGTRSCKECARMAVRRHRARLRANQQRLTPAEAAELRDWIASGRATALRRSAGLGLEDAARILSAGSKATVGRWEHGLAFPRWNYDVRYYAFLSGLSRQQAA